MRTLSNTLLAALGVLALGVPAARAQQQQTPDQQQQTPTNSNRPRVKVRRRFRPIIRLSLQPPTMTIPTPNNPRRIIGRCRGPRIFHHCSQPTRSYWQPQINVYGIAESNAALTAGNSNWTAGAALSGHVDVHRVTGNSDMNLNYSAGGSFSA